MIDEHIEVDEKGANVFVNEGIDFFQNSINCNQLEIFNVENFNVLLQYKWDAFGKNHHLIGFFFHMSYMLVLTVYTYLIYIMDSEHELKEKPVRNVMEWILVAGILYPAFYSFSQCYKAGICVYFSNVGSYLDMIYIWASITNTIFQKKFES